MSGFKNEVVDAAAGSQVRKTMSLAEYTKSRLVSGTGTGAVGANAAKGGIADKIEDLQDEIKIETDNDMLAHAIAEISGNDLKTVTELITRAPTTEGDVSQKVCKGSAMFSAKHWSTPIFIEKPAYAKRKDARITALRRSMKERIGVKGSVEVSESRPSAKRHANFVDKIDNVSTTTGAVGRPIKKLRTGRSVTSSQICSSN